MRAIAVIVLLGAWGVSAAAQSRVDVGLLLGLRF